MTEAKSGGKKGALAMTTERDYNMSQGINGHENMLHVFYVYESRKAFFRSYESYRTFAGQLYFMEEMGRIIRKRVVLW